MFDTVRNNSPNALELKCIEVRNKTHSYSQKKEKKREQINAALLFWALGVADIVYIVCIFGIDGIFYRAFWNTL